MFVCRLVCWLVDRSVCPSFCINFLKGGGSYIFMFLSGGTNIFHISTRPEFGHKYMYVQSNIYRITCSITFTLLITYIHISALGARVCARVGVNLKYLTTHCPQTAQDPLTPAYQPHFRRSTRPRSRWTGCGRPSPARTRPSSSPSRGSRSGCGGPTSSCATTKRTPT